METQIMSFYPTSQTNRLVSVFGYSSRAMPSLEINGVGSLAKNFKEKMIYLTRTRKLKVPNRRFVICVDVNELKHKEQCDLRWLEFPILLCFWHLAGLLPIKKLEDCLCSGTVSSNGAVEHLPLSHKTYRELSQIYASEVQSFKLITNDETATPLVTINSKLLLSHIPEMKFSGHYMESSSVKPSYSCIT